MAFKDLPIRTKLLTSIFLINGILLLVTCLTFFLYELYMFRETTVAKLSTIGQIISVNSTAALAFDDAEDAREILSALKTEKHLVQACLYDKNGKLFAYYPDTLSAGQLPARIRTSGHRFSKSNVEIFEPVLQDNVLRGTLYLKSDLGTMYDRFRLYAFITAIVIIISLLLAYVLAEILQRSISVPILKLAKTARVISGDKDYSVRASKTSNDEVGLLTNAFNQMLQQIQAQNENLSEFNQHLEEKIQERTAQLEGVNRELEAFSYSVSHDLRAPLRGIIGFTSILEDEYGKRLDEDAKSLTFKIKRNALRMGTLIDDLLSFSRLSRLDIDKSDLNISVLVNEVLSELEVDISKITWKIAPLDPSRGDVRMMRQVWINLISNAIKYSRNRPEPVIEIGSSREADFTCYYVRDNGVGFDDRYKEKLFQVFQRLHGSNEFEGTGVGLAIVEKIISRHGGRVWAEGKKDVGACFYFTLPVE